MGCGCKNAESGCGCGSKEMNWESYDKPSFTKTMMAESFNAEYAGGEYDDGEDYINTDHNTIYGQVNFMQITHNGTREHHNTAHFNIPVGDFLKINKKYIKIERDVYGAENFEAEEPVVQEPDWIPAGDGRAIGQQDFAINLSPLHAESRFDKLSNEIADEYEEKGMSPEKAQEVGDATAAKIGRAKYGKTGMRNMQKKGMRADMVGNPSPTFNEDITGQDGPSADPTNQTFEAMRTLAPSSQDVTRARRDLKNSGYGDVIYDRYMVNRDGSSNKFYYTAVTEKDGKYYPMGAYGRIGYLSKLFNIYGKSEGPKASLSTMDAAYRQCSTKENAKIKRGYVDYTLSMAESYRAESLSEIEGPTAEATTGGLHAPSSFAMTWEDGTGQSSASIPPNEIAWAEDVKAGEGKIFGIGIGTLALGALGIFGVKKLMDKKADTASVDDTKKAEKGCGCSKTVAKSETVRKHSEYSADRINPVEVEGQNDIHNAESISLPQPNAGPQTAHRQSNRPSLKLW